MSNSHKIEDLFVCPECKSRTEKKDPVLFCPACGKEYPLCGDIPDFRTILKDEASSWDAEAFERAYTNNDESFIDGTAHALASGIPDYAEKYRQESKGLLVKDYVFEKKPDLLLDLGCGYGWFCYELQERSPATCFYGADICEFRVNIFKKQIDKTGDSDKMTPLLSNAEKLPFPDASFDIVVMREVLEHLQAPESALKEIFRILKPGGSLLITTPTALMTNFWEFVAIIPAFLKRLFRGEKLIRKNVEEVYDFPLTVAEFKRISFLSGFEIEKWQRVIFLPHESYLQFIPHFLLKLMICAARIIKKMPFLHWLGLHHVVFLKKAQ